MRITEQVSRTERSTGTAARPPAATSVPGMKAGRAAHILELQRTVGNASVRRMIQCKLAVSQPGDPFEQEADRVAEAAMRVSEPAAEAAMRVSDPAAEEEKDKLAPKRLDRQVNEEDKDELALKRLDRQVPEEDKDEPTVARTASGDLTEVDGDVEAGIRGLSAGGAPMAPAVRSDMESRMGFDFSGVRVHSGGNATHLARSVNAAAFAVGNDVVFGGGQYRPETSDGKKLLAHELTHVVQQTGAAEKDGERGGAR